MSTESKDAAVPVSESKPVELKAASSTEPVASAGSAGATSVPKAGADDDDLDDLDDLLDDFAEDVLNKPPGSAKATTENQSVGGDAAEQGAASADKPINDEFKTRIEDLIKDLNIEDPETKDQFEKLVKEFEDDQQKVASEAMNNPQQFDDVMKDAMDRLKKSGENIDEQLKNDPSGGNPEDMLTQLLAGLGGAGGGAGGDFDMSKLLVDMLEQLSSKEVLYEPIKDLNSKFPEFLSEKKGVIADDQHATYTKQYEITTDILAIFEAPGYTDNDKQKRDKVNTLLESLQELGQPPSELVGDASDFPGFGGAGGLGGAGGGLDFSDKDLPPDFGKDLEEGCKQT